MKTAVKVLAKGLTTTLVVLVCTEVVVRGSYFVRNSMVRYVPLPYAFGDDYGPRPPWLERLEILRGDKALLWKNEPNASRTYLDLFTPVGTVDDRIALWRRFNPTLPQEYRQHPTWKIRLNSEGYRSHEFSAPRHPATVRIACIGDSWTFGSGANQDETYPSRLATWLQREHPSAQYEVMNFGVLGYSSFQGLQVLKSRVLDLNPDVVVIGFAMNDAEVAGYRDKDVPGSPEERRTMVERASRIMQGLELYKLLRYESLVLKFRPKPIATYLTEGARTKGADPANYDELEPWTRVSPRDYDANIRTMIHLAKERRAEVVLLDNDVSDKGPYRPVLKKIAQDLDVPLVDSVAIIEAARTTIEQSLETTLDLQGHDNDLPKSDSDKTTVVFRVYRGLTAVPKGLSIVGADPQFGALVPNTVAMHDDGTGGDQRADDGVWSYLASFAPGLPLAYIYTNSGTPGRWQGLDLPHIRHVQIPTTVGGQPVYLPIETFGRVYMRSDDWHTDAVGYDLIGHAVARVLADRVKEMSQ